MASPRADVRPATSSHGTRRADPRSTNATPAGDRRVTTTDGPMPATAAPPRATRGRTTVVPEASAPSTAATARPRPARARPSDAGPTPSEPAVTRRAASATVPSPVAGRPRTTGMTVVSAGAVPVVDTRARR